MACTAACSGWLGIRMGCGFAFSTPTLCPKAALAQRKHNAITVIFINILVWGTRHSRQRGFGRNDSFCMATAITPAVIEWQSRYQTPAVRIRVRGAGGALWERFCTHVESRKTWVLEVCRRLAAGVLFSALGSRGHESGSWHKTKEVLSRKFTLALLAHVPVACAH